MIVVFQHFLSLLELNDHILSAREARQSFPHLPVCVNNYPCEKARQSFPHLPVCVNNYPCEKARQSFPHLPVCVNNYPCEKARQSFPHLPVCVNNYPCEKARQSFPHLPVCVNNYPCEKARQSFPHLPVSVPYRSYCTIVCSLKFKTLSEVIMWFLIIKCLTHYFRRQIVNNFIKQSGKDSQISLMDVYRIIHTKEVLKCGIVIIICQEVFCCAKMADVHEVTDDLNDFVSDEFDIGIFNAIKDIRQKSVEQTVMLFLNILHPHLPQTSMQNLLAIVYTL